jgi:starch synthase
MTHQKGWDLLADAIPRVLPDRAQFVLVGSGDERLEKAARELAGRHPGSVGYFDGYDEGLAHLVFAGSDIFTVPSRFEPAGLTQMYAQCYGTPPVVHRTGGLADSVTEVTTASVEEGTGTGFFFDQPTSEALAAALRRAIGVYRGDPDTWTQVQTNGMQRDFSWQAAAGRYIEVYEQALEDRRHRPG